MNRYFKVACTVAPSLPSVPSAQYELGFSKGMLDAAILYAKENLSGYQVIPGGVAYQGGHRFDAINHEEGLGASLFVSETLGAEEEAGEEELDIPPEMHSPIGMWCVSLMDKPYNGSFKLKTDDYQEAVDVQGHCGGTLEPMKGNL